jgi:predicted nucleic acid-binding protein
VIKVTGSKLFLDSCIWLGYFLGNIPETRALVDSEETILFTSVISIHEILKKLKKLGKTGKETSQALKLIEDNSIIVGLSKDIAMAAVSNCEKYGLHTIDSLIYSSAMETETLFVTADEDFKKTPKTRIIEIR